MDKGYAIFNYLVKELDSVINECFSLKGQGLAPGQGQGLVRGQGVNDKIIVTLIKTRDYLKFIALNNSIFQQFHLN